MPIQLSVPDETTRHLNQPAIIEFRGAVEKYADDLVKEAGRLEASANTAQRNPEITSSMVHDADLLLRRGYARPKKSKLLISTQILATVGGFLTGFLSDVQLLSDPLTLIIFVAILSITIVSAVIVVMKE